MTPPETRPPRTPKKRQASKGGVVSLVHRTAIIHPKAQLGEGVTVGPYAVIDQHVVIGARTKVGAHAVIEGRTTIGSDCEIRSEEHTSELQSQR